MNNSNASPNGFEFTISNGTVTAMERVLGSKTFDLHIPSNASFSVGTSTVTETITGSFDTDVLQFVQDSSNASLYHLASDTLRVANPTTTDSNGRTFGYSFTVTNGSVTAEQVVHGNSTTMSTHTVQIPSTASFSVSDSAVTETVVYGNVVETIQFVASGSSSLYAVASDSKTFIQQGAATTALSVDPFDRAKFTIDASGNVTAVQAVQQDGTLKDVTVSSNIAYTQLASGYVLETHTRGSNTTYEVYHDGNGDGIYTEVAHGTGSTVDLVGLKAQLTSGIEAVL